MSKEEILELLDELTNRLEGPAAHVFELAVRNTLSGAVIAIIASVLFLTGGIYLLRLCVSKFEDALDDFGWGILGALGAIAAVVSVIVIFNNVHTLMNIEYQALRSLVPGL